MRQTSYLFKMRSCSRCLRQPQTRPVIPAAPPSFLLLSFSVCFALLLLVVALVFGRVGISDQRWQALSLVKASALLPLLCPTLPSLALSSGIAVRTVAMAGPTSFSEHRQNSSPCKPKYPKSKSGLRNTFSQRDSPRGPNFAQLKIRIK
jgi:hypothetical protein